MTRRTFLRVLGSAVAVAAVAPVLQPIAEVVQPTGWWSVTDTAGPITYEMLEQSYKQCVIGSERPTMGVCSVSFARQYGLVFDVDFEDAA